MTCYTNIKKQNNIIECLSIYDKKIYKPIQSIIQTLELWRQRTEDRKQLAGLTERILKDAGISKLDAKLEIAKPFWRE